LNAGNHAEVCVEVHKGVELGFAAIGGEAVPVDGPKEHIGLANDSQLVANTGCIGIHGIPLGAGAVALYNLFVRSSHIRQHLLACVLGGNGSNAANARRITLVQGNNGVHVAGIAQVCGVQRKICI
jgi:hypothetical protein